MGVGLEVRGGTAARTRRSRRLRGRLYAMVGFSCSVTVSLWVLLSLPHYSLRSTGYTPTSTRDTPSRTPERVEPSLTQHLHPSHQHPHQTRQSSLDSLNDDILRLKLELQSCCTDDEWTHADLRLLSKGLNFCPTPPAFDQAELSQDLTHFFRRIRLREFFLDDPPTEREPFCKKSSWMPPKNRVPVLEAYTQVVSSETNQLSSPQNTRQPSKR
ncbi:hypothetical protein BSL78_25839 [Apostichopus japonicus]|uniref:Uncharacterized protein n=1 Tax=Stichopus japonicus TaxID=307972 RepID=A0A2G8JNN6_STIJA|nr:hypothetical protein BSL78_25839 [Apostichopus japonicus]